MKTGAIAFLLAVLFLPLCAIAAAGYIRTLNGLPPTPQYIWPDTNFTDVTYGFPTIPFSQVLANGHLYVAFGAYLGIYEVQPNGTIVETCLKMMPQHMASIAHNEEYLFIEGEDGLQIFQGTNYHPQLDPG